MLHLVNPGAASFRAISSILIYKILLTNPYENLMKMVKSIAGSDQCTDPIMCYICFGFGYLVSIPNNLSRYY